LCCWLKSFLRRVAGQCASRNLDARMLNFRQVLQQLCCAHRTEPNGRALERIHIANAVLPANVRRLSHGFGKVSTKLRILYTSTGPDADRFDEAFHRNDLRALVDLLDSKQAVDSLIEPKHPWAEDPRTVGALAAMQLALLASVVGEDDASVREDIGRAGGIAPLARLVESRDSDGMQAAVVAMKYLTEESRQNSVAAFEAGALPPLIKLLGHSMAGLRGAAASCLRNMCTECEACHEHLAELGGIGVMVGQLDFPLDVSKDHDHDLLLEAVWNLEDMTADQDGKAFDRYCRLAVEAGAVEKLRKLREVGAGELLLAVEKLLQTLETFTSEKKD